MIKTQGAEAASVPGVPIIRQNLWTALCLAFFALFTITMAHAQERSIIVDDGIVSKIQMNPRTTITVITNQPFADILIGNTDLIDVFPLTDTSLYIQAKGTGLTNVTLYNIDKRLIEVIDVRVRSDFSELEGTLRRAVPSANVSVTNVNDRIRLSGSVKDNRDLQTVLEIAQKFSAEPVINSVRVESPQQVELDVRILEVERNSGRALGVGLAG